MSPFERIWPFGSVIKCSIVHSHSPKASRFGLRPWWHWHGLITIQPYKIYIYICNYETGIASKEPNTIQYQCVQPSSILQVLSDSFWSVNICVMDKVCGQRDLLGMWGSAPFLFPFWCLSNAHITTQQQVAACLFLPVVCISRCLPESCQIWGAAFIVSASFQASHPLQGPRFPRKKHKEEQGKMLFQM